MILSPNISSSPTLRNKSARTAVFAVFTARYEFIGACHWTQVTQVWDIFDLCGGEKGWVIYHNNQRLRHHKVGASWRLLCLLYERCDSNSPCQCGLPATDIAQELEPIVPTPSHGEAAGSTAPAPSVDEAVDTTQSTGPHI